MFAGGSVPSSLFQCFRDGEERCLDPYRYFQFMRARGQENQTAVLRTIIAACNLIADEEGREQLELDEKSGKRGPYKKREPRWRLAIRADDSRFRFSSTASRTLCLRLPSLRLAIFAMFDK